MERVRERNIMDRLIGALIGLEVFDGSVTTFVDIFNVAAINSTPAKVAAVSVSLVIPALYGAFAYAVSSRGLAQMGWFHDNAPKTP